MNKKKTKTLLKNIKYNLKKLKRYDRLETKEEIQIIKYDVPVEYFDFKEKKVINFYESFAIMIGLLDGFINKRLSEIKDKKNKKYLYRYEQELRYIKNARDNISLNLINIEHKLSESDRNVTKSIKESIINYPATKNFNNIYEEEKTSKYNHVYIDFINKYNIGYQVANDLKFRDIIYMNRNYNELFNSLYQKYIYNEKKIEKVRTKEKQKRYVNYF